MKKILEITDKYSAIIFIVSIIAIIVVLRINNKNRVECPTTYEDTSIYKYTLDYKNNDIEKVYNIEKNNNKYIITSADEEYYIYYTDVYKKINDEYIILNEYIIENVDNKLFIIDFILDIKDDNGSIYSDNNIIKLTTDTYEITYTIL